MQSEKFIYGVPDEVFYSDNEYDIPTLDSSKQADSCEAPFIKWGVTARGKNLGSGTVHFFTDDYKFKGIWKAPEKLITTGVCTVAEVDYSTNDQTPISLFLASLYKKRWLSRFWQKHGVLVLVNLNVAQHLAEHNLIGVPQGWHSYITRYNPDLPEKMQADYMLACRHAGTDDILFITYGGGKSGKAFAQSIQQPWVIDQAHETRLRIQNG